MTGDESAEGTEVSCQYEILTAPTQAVDALPVPITTTFTISPLGISGIVESMAVGSWGDLPGGLDPLRLDLDGGEVGFDHVAEPFLKWLAANRPDVTCLAQTLERGWCGAWPSPENVEGPFQNVEEWTGVGHLISQYAQEWAAYLQENNCGYLDGC